MTGLSHGADADRLDAIGTALARQGERIGAVGDQMGSAMLVLRDAWMGPDTEAMLGQAEVLRPSIADAGHVVSAFGLRLREEAQQQRQASGALGPTPVTGGASLAGRRGGAEIFGGRRASGTAGLAGGAPDLTGSGSPLLSTVAATPRADGGGGDGRNHTIEESEDQTGEVKRPGSVNLSDTTDMGVVERTDSVTLSTSEEEVGADGESVQTTSISASSELTAELDALLLSLGVTTGAEISYSVTGPVDGSFDPKDATPYDPSTLPEGASITMDAKTYAALGIETSLKGLTLELAGESGVNHQVEITKGEGDLVTVTVSDQAYRDGMMSVSRGPVEGELGTSFSSGNGKEVTFDLSDPAARQAYYEMVYGGQIPDAETSGVTDIADVQVMSYESAMRANLDAGPVDLSVGDGKDSALVSRTFADGTSEVQVTSEGGNGATIHTTNAFDADGNVDPAGSAYEIRVDSVDPDTANYYNNLYAGEQTSISTEQNVVISYTDADLQTMRSQAAEARAQHITDNPDFYPNFPNDGTPVTGDEVLAYLEANPDKAIDVTTGLTGGQATEDILLAQSNEEILLAMANHPQGALVWQTELATDYAGTGGLVDPVGEVTSHESAD